MPDAAVPPGKTTLIATFPEGERAAISEGREYAVVVGRDAVYLSVGVHSSDVCPNGRLFSRSGTGTFTPTADWDLVFTALV